MNKQLAVMFSGNGSNLEAILTSEAQGFFQGICNIKIVICNKENALGIQIAKKFQKECLLIKSEGKSQNEFDSELISVINDYNIDYLVLAGFMRILSPKIIKRLPGRILNIHPADTTEYQGRKGYEWAWEQQKKNTKITVHVVDAGVDTGEIICQETLNLQNITSLSTLKQQGLALEHRLYSSTIRNYICAKEFVKCVE